MCHTFLRSVYKELHADHETGAADNKLRLNTEHRKSARCSACFVVRGFQRGLPLGTRLCLQSVVCYTLCRRCCENAVAAGEGKGIFTAGKQGCDCVAWSRKRRTGFISRQGVYESPRSSSHAGLRDKMSRTCGHTHKKQTDFSLKIGMGGEAILGLCYLPDK